MAKQENGPPPGKHLFGTVRVGERGQIVIPKNARELFNIRPGDELLVMGDEDSGGLAVIKNDVFMAMMARYMEGILPGRKKDERN